MSSSNSFSRSHTSQATCPSLSRTIRSSTGTKVLASIARPTTFVDRDGTIRYRGKMTPIGDSCPSEADIAKHLLIHPILNPEVSEEIMEHDEIVLDDKAWSRNTMQTKRHKKQEDKKKKTMSFNHAIAPFLHTGRKGNVVRESPRPHKFVSRKHQPVSTPAIQKEPTRSSLKPIPEVQNTIVEDLVVETVLEPEYEAASDMTWLTLGRPAESTINTDVFSTFRAFLSSVDGDVQTIGFVVLDVASCLYNLSRSQDVFHFTSTLYSSLRLLYKDIGDAHATRIANLCMGMITTQDTSTAAGWRALSNFMHSVWDGTVSWLECPMLDTFLDLLNVFVFLGFMKSESIDIMDRPNYSVFARKIKKEVTGLPDLLSIVMKASMMITDCLASYFEDGILDFTGWAVGSKRELFVEYAAVMAEQVEAKLGTLHHADRDSKCKYRSQEEFGAALNRVIDRSTIAMRNAKLAEKNIYSRLLKDAMMIKNDITIHQRCAAARVKPYTFCVCGTTSSMKSTVQQAVWRQIASSNGISTAQTNMCTVNFKDEYFSEVQMQEVLVMDDFMNERPNTNSKVNPIRILLDWSSNNTVQMPAAAIEDKGKRYCLAKILGMTCHSKQFHAETMSYQPEAAYRRVEVFIDTVLRPEFRDAEGRPDFTKIPREDHFPDIFDFTLWQCAIFGTEHKFVRIGGTKVYNNAELLDFLAVDSVRHFAVQTSITTKLNNEAGWMCPHGRINGACVACKEVLHVDEEEAVAIQTLDDEDPVVAHILEDDLSVVESQVSSDAPSEEDAEFNPFDNLPIREGYTEGDATHAFNGVFGEGGDVRRAYWNASHQILIRAPEEDWPIFLNELHHIHATRGMLLAQDYLSIVEDNLVAYGHVHPPEVQSAIDPAHTDLPEPAFHRMSADEYHVVIPRDIPASFFSRAHYILYWKATLTNGCLARGIAVDVDYIPSDDAFIFRVRTVAHLSDLEVQGGKGCLEIQGMKNDPRRGKHKTKYTALAALNEKIDTFKDANPDYEDMPEFDILCDQWCKLYYNSPWFWRPDEITRIKGVAVGVYEHLTPTEEYSALRLPAKTIVGSARKKLVKRVMEEYVTGKSTYTTMLWLTSWNILAISKGFFLTCGGCFLSLGLVYGFALTVQSLVRNVLGGVWSYSNIKMAVRIASRMLRTRVAAALDIGSHIERALDGYVPRELRIEAVASQQGERDGPAAYVFHRLRMQLGVERVPSALEIAFGRRGAQRARSIVNYASYAAGAFLLYKLWQCYHECKPVMLDVEKMNCLTDMVTAGDSTQGAVAGVIPKLPGEHKGVWVKLADPKFQIGQASKTIRPEDLKAKLKRNLAAARLTWPGDSTTKFTHFHALCVGGFDWLIPTHCMPDDVDDFVLNTMIAPGAGPNAVGSFSRRNTCSIEGTDFTLVRLVGAIPKCSILPYFPIEETALVFAHLLYYNNEEDALQETANVRMPKSTISPVTRNKQAYREMSVAVGDHYPIDTFPGLCGAVWFGNPISKPFIHSLHICGVADTKFGGSAVITIGMLEEARKTLSFNGILPAPMAEEFNMDILAPEVQTKWEPSISAQHPLNFVAESEGQPVVDIIGTHDSHSGKYSQNIEPTLIADELTRSLGWEQGFKPVPRPNAACHINHGLDEILFPRNEYIATVLDRAVEDLQEHIMEYIDEIPDLWRHVLPLVDTIVVSGQDGIVGVDQMNPSTSAGFPERGAKGRFYVPSDEDVPVSDPRTLDDAHLQCIREMEEKLASGERIYAPFTLSVKIEPTKVHKEFARLFGGSNVCFTFLFRKYYLSIFRLIQINPMRFETALGINCQSEDWNEVAKHLRWHDRMIEGDYQTYDKTMGAAFILRAFGILIKIAARAGYEPKALRIMQNIACEVAYPTYEARGVLFVAGGSNPSGHPGTFVINCLVNSIFMRYGYYWSLYNLGYNVRTIPVRFREHVRVITAGDDHLAGVSPECSWFDQNVMQQAMASIRIGYTDGKKNPVFEHDFTTLSEASFVSRNFRWCVHEKRYVGPLLIKSLKKSYMIHNWPKNPVFTPAEQIAIIVIQNETELYLLGEEVFLKYYFAIRDAMVTVGLGSFLTPERSWAEVGKALKDSQTTTFIKDLTIQSAVMPNQIFTTTGQMKSVRVPLITDDSLSSITVARLDPQLTTQGSACLGERAQQPKSPATNSNSITNGMTASANVMHDMPSALAWSASRGTVRDGTRDMYSTDTDSLASYLERPVLIAALEWGIGVTLYEKYDILQTILEVTPINQKLSYFTNLIFDLEIDVEVSANPFLYGLLMLNWVPYPKYDGLLRDRGLINSDNIEASQRQKLFVDASTSSGGKMIIPFFWPANYFSLTKDDPTDFGYLSVRQINDLKHVSGSDQKVTVYIRAKMINVRMHTSTTAAYKSHPEMSLQGDESPNDKLSSKATRVAKVASALTPVFGGYALATEKAASAAAGVLRAMGLSHPRSKEMTHKFENRPLGNIANFNVPSSAITLALDEHNEVTIDPYVASLTEDEMALNFILGKESLIDTIPWMIDDQEGSTLSFHRVHPLQFHYEGGIREYHLSPMAYVARLFQFWTGSIKFRFQIVCSAWHRGRLRIIHEPVYTATALNTMWQTNLQSVFDITEERDFTIEVSYAQAQAWLSVGNVDSTLPCLLKKADGLAYSPSNLKEANGVLLLTVMNRLVVPDDTIVAPAYINLYVSAGSDFQLAVPKINLTDMSITDPMPPAPAVQTQALSGQLTNVIIPGATTATIGSDNTQYPYYSNASPFTVRYYASPGQVPSLKITSAQKTGSTGGTVTLTTSAGSASGTAGSSAPITVLLPPVLTEGFHNAVVTPTTPTGTGFVITAAEIPQKPGFVWQTAYASGPPTVRYDAVTDLGTGTYPLNMLRGGAPSVRWKTTGSTGLYETSNHGEPVFVTHHGDIWVVNGVYTPPIATWSNGENITTNSYVPPTTGYGATTVNLLWQGHDVADPTDISTGNIYNAIFLKQMSTQSEDAMDETTAMPDTPPTLTSFHDTTIAAKDPFVYMGEKILHLRQIIGRPQYNRSYVLLADPDATITRNYIQAPNIPSYPNGLEPASPLYFMMACYNSWRGSTRARYFMNFVPGNAPIMARLEREESEAVFDSQTHRTFVMPTDIYFYTADSYSLWGGAAITNPSLANELQAEFPYYYRFRFRNARPSKVEFALTATDSHKLVIDVAASTDAPVLVDRYFQPGEDFTLLNWMGTPVLFATS